MVRAILQGHRHVVESGYIDSGFGCAKHQALVPCNFNTAVTSCATARSKGGQVVQQPAAKGRASQNMAWLLLLLLTACGGDPDQHDATPQLQRHSRAQRKLSWAKAEKEGKADSKACT